jgi:hypothetical protein
MPALRFLDNHRRMVWQLQHAPRSHGGRRLRELALTNNACHWTVEIAGHFSSG